VSDPQKGRVWTTSKYLLRRFIEVAMKGFRTLQFLSSPSMCQFDTYFSPVRLKAVLNAMQRMRLLFDSI
jgi:hypothetical protein